VLKSLRWLVRRAPDRLLERRLFRKVSAFGCKDGWESGELTEELGVAFWAGKKVFSF
jgi:hypothetical protein